MKRTTLLLFLVSFLHIATKGDEGTYLFVTEQKNWTQARAHCRKTYTDLATVRTNEDNEKLLEIAGKDFHFGWIGLYRDRNDADGWKWSGGEKITYKNWKEGEPNNNKGTQTKVAIVSGGKWYDERGSQSIPFFCMKLPAMEEKKSWEKALDHCRKNQMDLVSIVSVSDRVRIREQIKLSQFTGLEWIGLRFLGDRWLWLNGDPLVNETWSKEKRWCPLKKRCGALNKEGKLEKRDCTMKLRFLCK